MIDLIVTGCEQPEQSREEIARLLKEYGVGAVCLLRDGSVYDVTRANATGFKLGERFDVPHEIDGAFIPFEERNDDIIRVFPPGTRLRVTVEVIND